MGTPGVVAGDVELAEIAFGFRQGVDNGSLLRHIDPHRHDPLVGAGEAVSSLLDRVFLNVGHDDVGAGLREGGRDSEANARSGAGHDGGFAGDVHAGDTPLFRLLDLLHQRQAFHREPVTKQILHALL